LTVFDYATGPFSGPTPTCRQEGRQRPNRFHLLQHFPINVRFQSLPDIAVPYQVLQRGHTYISTGLQVHVECLAQAVEVHRPTQAVCLGDPGRFKVRPHVPHARQSIGEHQVADTPGTRPSGPQRR